MLKKKSKKKDDKSEPITVYEPDTDAFESAKEKADSFNFEEAKAETRPNPLPKIKEAKTNKVETKPAKQSNKRFFSVSVSFEEETAVVEFTGDKNTLDDKALENTINSLICSVGSVLASAGNPTTSETKSFTVRVPAIANASVVKPSLRAVVAKER